LPMGGEGELGAHENPLPKGDGFVASLSVLHADRC
jgi:hypothetical protein